MNYYNEHDVNAAAWLDVLIHEGLIADGEVDTRSIVDVRAADLRGFMQCHFFAGIGGWSAALRLAGWPDDRPVWTGSCPCQPFSMAGDGGGTDDPRHLWPAWRGLIRECRPPTIFGEQVSSPDGLYWLDLVFADLEADHYAIGAVNLPAASVGAPHIRQRLWFVADHYAARRLGDTGSAGLQERTRNGCVQRTAVESSEGQATERRGDVGDLADPNSALTSNGDLQRSGRFLQPSSDAIAGVWSACDWIACRDGKWRPVEPGSFPLAYGVPARVGRLRGYGNAIVPQVAQIVIASYLDMEHK